MHVWLPYPNYKLSARVMSTDDLITQIHDIEKVLAVLHQTDDELADEHWNNPVVEAWRGYETQLAEYGLTCIEECNQRAYSLLILCDQCNRGMIGHVESITHHQLSAESGGLLKPDWFGNVNLHTSHKSGLLAKDFEYYEPFFPHVRSDIDVQWKPQDAA